MTDTAQDPGYARVSASRRKGKLYVKATLEKVVVFIGALIKSGEDLLRKEIYHDQDSRSQTFVFAGSVEDWQEDLQTLAVVAAQDNTGMVEMFRTVIELGLESDPAVDWIARVRNADPPQDSAQIENPDDYFEFSVPFIP